MGYQRRHFIKTFLIIFSLGVFLITFQNCGDEVAFSPDVSGDASTIDGNAIKVSDSEAQAAVEELVDSMEIYDTDGTPCDCESEEHEQEALNSGDKGPCQRREGEVASTEEDEDKNEIESESKEDDNKTYSEDEKYVRTCEMAKLIAKHYEVTSEEVKNFTDLTGLQIYSSDSFDVLKSLRGKILVIGTGGLDSSKVINSIEDVRGKLVICNMSVESINDFRGNAVIVNGSVGDIQNVQGSLKVINGQIMGSQSNISGKVNTK